MTRAAKRSAPRSQASPAKSRLRDGRGKASEEDAGEDIDVDGAESDDDEDINGEKVAIHRFFLILFVLAAVHTICVLPMLYSVTLHVDVVDERCPALYCTFRIYYALAYPYCTVAPPVYVKTATFNNTHVQLGEYICNAASCTNYTTGFVATSGPYEVEPRDCNDRPVY